MSDQQVAHSFTNRQTNIMAVCAFLIIPMSGLAVDIYVPSLPEQIKIANFLSVIDNKVNHVLGQIEKLEMWKKGLLQKMFV